MKIYEIDVLMTPPEHLPRARFVFSHPLMRGVSRNAGTPHILSKIPWMICDAQMDGLQRKYHEKPISQSKMNGHIYKWMVSQSKMNGQKSKMDGHIYKWMVSKSKMNGHIYKWMVSQSKMDENCLVVHPTNRKWVISYNPGYKWDKWGQVVHL